MRIDKRRIPWLWVMMTAWTATAGGQAAQAARSAGPVNSFETADDVAVLVPNQVKVRVTERHATQGRRAVEIRFEPADWPGVRLIAPGAWDCGAFDGLAVDITNPGREPVTFGIRVDDDPAADGVRHSRAAMATIEPGVMATFAINLREHPMTLGVRGLPVVPGVRCLGMQSDMPINRGHIVAFQLFMDHPKEARTLILDNVRPLDWMVPLDSAVDLFGQFSKADWPGKLTHVREFVERREAEAAEIQQHPHLPDRDRFGGWTAGPTLDATGWFRAEKVGGQWWLVTPAGRLFFSVGVDCVLAWNGTITTGREHMFSWLPGEEDPYARHFGPADHVHRGPVKKGMTYNFFAANLHRKYGRDFKRTWLDHSLSRLVSWGFNTIGNWSDHKLYGNGRVPYVATVNIQGDHARVRSGVDYWGPMHDPYDPQFAANAEKAVRQIAQLVRDDPWCVGYFVDNELSWGGFGNDAERYGLACGTLAGEPTSPAKQAMLGQLRGKYDSVMALNRAWGTQLAGFEALEVPFTAPAPLTEGMKADLAAFSKALAGQYFRIVRDAIRRHDPHHMYLGCRFAWHTPEAIAAAAEYCDVVSFNIYRPRLDASDYPVLASLDKPCIIGEFHSGALDRGMWHGGLIPVADQQARADMYRQYVRSVIDHPLFVGCHWFQYVDQPLTGRSYDGENYNIGFVTVTDTPYPELVEAAREVHEEMYPRRWKQSKGR